MLTRRMVLGGFIAAIIKRALPWNGWRPVRNDLPMEDVVVECLARNGWQGPGVLMRYDGRDTLIGLARYEVREGGAVKASYVSMLEVPITHWRPASETLQRWIRCSDLGAPYAFPKKDLALAAHSPSQEPHCPTT